MKPMDELLGRDFRMYRRDRVGWVASMVTVTAYDPEKGIKLYSKMHGDGWVPVKMYEQLLEHGVLECA